ncbi:Hypothetical protein CINCED_3A006549 [Cinara cedri]|uniref:Reverse transcriptase domain n=1 Tax=Cinara cedri TaxID=506608 RepID=A0A5E4N1S2_9HEMI|nr:Hypothetical protein CINCED_3A006549 [Cinara cedri]
MLTSPTLERMNPYAEEIVGNYKCRFRRGKSTTDHIFALGQIMSKYYEFRKVRFLRGILDPFEVKSGLKQGDKETLFDQHYFTYEKIIKGTNEDRMIEISNDQVLLAYADDIVVMGETKEEDSLTQHPITKMQVKEWGTKRKL